MSRRAVRVAGLTTFAVGGLVLTPMAWFFGRLGIERAVSWWGRR